MNKTSDSTRSHTARPSFEMRPGSPMSIKTPTIDDPSLAGFNNRSGSLQRDSKMILNYDRDLRKRETINSKRSKK